MCSRAVEVLQRQKGEATCRWVKRKVKCRFPQVYMLGEDSPTQLFTCICCLLGWHLELSKLKEAET